MRYPQPANEDDFEEFCLVLLRRHWDCPSLERYGHRGQRQDGVDLIDPIGTEPLRAAQCKHHASHKGISIAELVAEINKAKKFPIKIGIYYFLTTAKNSTQIQIELIKINKAHTAENLFKVVLLTWEGIERLINDHPDVWPALEKLHSSALISHMTEHKKSIEQLTSITLGSHKSLMETMQQASSDLEIELKDIKDSIDENNYQLARILVRRIQEKNWDRLQPRQKYRLLINLSNILFAEEKHNEAAQTLIEAKKYQPDSTNALANEALAYEILNLREKAFLLAEKILLDNPAHCKAAVVFVRTAPDDRTVEELEKFLFPVSIDEELAVAFSTRGLLQEKFDFSRRYAQKAISINPNWFASWLAVGKANIAEEFFKFSRRADEKQKKINSFLIDEAIDALTRAINLGKESNNRFVIAEALITRAKIYGLRSLYEAETADIEEAYKYVSDHPEVLIQHAHLLQSKGELLGAVEDLRKAIRLGAGNIARMFLASLLNSTDEDNCVAEASEIWSEIWSELATHSLTHYQADAALYGLQTILKQRGQEHATAFLESVKPHIENILFITLQGILAHTCGQADEAKGYAAQLQNYKKQELAPSVTRQIANFLTNIQFYSEALQFWKTLAIPGAYNPDTHSLIVCAQNIEDHALQLQIFKELRESEVEPPEYFHNEIALLIGYDPEEALRILSEHVSKNKNDKAKILLLALIAHRVGKQELIHLDENELPALGEIPSEWMTVLIEMLQSHGSPSIDTLRYAYRLVRANFDKHEAHLAYLHAIGIGSRKAPPVEEVQIVCVDCAVAYSENDAGLLTWLIIEEDTEEGNIGRGFRSA